MYVCTMYVCIVAGWQQQCCAAAAADDVFFFSTNKTENENLTRLLNTCFVYVNSFLFQCIIALAICGVYV